MATASTRGLHQVDGYSSRVLRLFEVSLDPLKVCAEHKRSIQTRRKVDKLLTALETMGECIAS